MRRSWEEGVGVEWVGKRSSIRKWYTDLPHFRFSGLLLSLSQEWRMEW